MVLNLNLSRASAQRLRDFTAANVGGRLAVLVDGRPLKVVKVLDPIHGDGVLIGLLNARPLRHSLLRSTIASAGERDLASA